MTALELLHLCAEAGQDYQLYINQFVDDFRRADAEERAVMVAVGPSESGKLAGLIAAVVSTLCREVGLAAPAWVRTIHSPEPFFVLNARGFALRLRLMLESPPAFLVRNVFVPEDYLSRA